MYPLVKKKQNQIKKLSAYLFLARSNRWRVGRLEKGQELVDAVLDETRLKLLNILVKFDRKYISELTKALDLDRATVSYHLSVLESAGVVSSEYKILDEPRSKGRAARYYSINRQKLNEAVEAVRGLLPASR